MIPFFKGHSSGKRSFVITFHRRIGSLTSWCSVDVTVIPPKNTNIDYFIMNTVAKEVSPGDTFTYFHHEEKK